MATIPAPSDGGSWDYEYDFENDTISNGTDLASHLSGDGVVNVGTANAIEWDSTDLVFWAQTSGGNYQFQGYSAGIDLEILGLVTSDAWQDDYLWMAGRRVGGGTGYGIEWDDPDDWELYDFDAGSPLDTQLDAPGDGERWWVRLRIVGSSIEGSAWDEAGAEPSWPQMSTTDTSSTGGYPAVLTSSISAPETIGLVALAVKEVAGDVTVTPAAVAAVSSVGDPDVTVVAGPPPVSSVAAVPDPGVTVDTNPASTALTTTIGDADVAVGALPAVISVPVAAPDPDVTVEASPTGVAAVTAVPQATPAGGTATQPATVTAAAAVTAPTVAVTAGPATVAAATAVLTPVIGQITYVSPATVQAAVAVLLATVLAESVAVGVTHRALSVERRHDVSAVELRHQVTEAL